MGFISPASSARLTTAFLMFHLALFLSAGSPSCWATSSGVAYCRNTWSSDIPYRSLVLPLGAELSPPDLAALATADPSTADQTGSSPEQSIWRRRIAPNSLTRARSFVNAVFKDATSPEVRLLR